MTAMPFRYAVYGLMVESDFALASLSPCPEGSAADLRLRRASSGHFAPLGAEAPAPHWYRYRSLPQGGVHLGIPGILDAEVSADGRSAFCAPAPGGDARAFEANILNFVLTIALTLRGEEPLHATTVAVGRRAVGLLGDSGSGKSTLAAQLLSEGATLVTDDMLRVGYDGATAVAYRGPPRLKLFDEQARRLMPAAARDASFNPMSGKLLVEVGGRPGDDGVALAALIRLQEPPDGTQVSVRRVEGSEAILTLLASTLHRDHRPAPRMAGQLRQIERLARTVPLFVLGYPRRHDMLPAVAAAVRRCA